MLNGRSGGDEKVEKSCFKDELCNPKALYRYVILSTKNKYGVWMEKGITNKSHALPKVRQRFNQAFGCKVVYQDMSPPTASSSP